MGKEITDLYKSIQPVGEFKIVCIKMAGKTETLMGLKLGPNSRKAALAYF